MNEPKGAPEREAFEAAIRGSKYNEYELLWNERGYYEDSGTQRMWNGWQLATAASKAPVEAPADVLLEIRRAFFDFKEQFGRSLTHSPLVTDHVGNAEVVLFDRIRAATAPQAVEAPAPALKDWAGPTAKAVMGALRASINDHGPITSEMTTSAMKRILGALQAVEAPAPAVSQFHRAWGLAKEQDRFYQHNEANWRYVQYWYDKAQAVEAPADDLSQLAEQIKRIADNYADGCHTEGYFGAIRANLHRHIDRLVLLASKGDTP